MTALVYSRAATKTVATTTSGMATARTCGPRLSSAAAPLSFMAGGSVGAWRGVFSTMKGAVGVDVLFTDRVASWSGFQVERCHFPPLVELTGSPGGIERRIQGWKGIDTCATGTRKGRSRGVWKFDYAQMHFTILIPEDPARMVFLFFLLLLQQ